MSLGGVTFRTRAAYLEEPGVLVVADLHLGRDTTSAVELRLGEHEDLTERFSTVLETFDPQRVVFAGDVLHSFGSLPRGVAETLRDLRRIAHRADTETVITPGNHDTMLQELWDGPTESEIRIDDTVILHGDDPPEMTAELYIVGHDHPAIRIEGRKHPCFLFGPAQFNGADVLMVPAFNRLVPGVVVNNMAADDFHSPLVVDAGALQPIVRDPDAEETLGFPALGQFRGML